MPTARRTVPRWLATLAVTAAACALALAAGPGAVHAANAQSQPISRSEVIARAQNWYERNVPYSQGGTASDPDGSHTYRRDCSGFVSMAWHLSADGMGAATTSSLPNYANSISKSSLKAGDILDYPGHHTVLFEKWANADHTQFVYFSEGSTATDMNHTTASLSSYSSYHAYRYKKIAENGPAGALGSLAVGTTCSTTNYGEIHLPNMRNIQLTASSCIRNAAGTVHGWVTVSWVPNSDGTDDSSTIGNAKFDGFTVYPQLQLNDRTDVEGHCAMQAAINAADSGSSSCEITLSAATATGLTTDYWMDWDKNLDGRSWQGAVYFKASPAL